MHKYRSIRRTNLFLVRIWREGSSEIEDNADQVQSAGSDPDGGGGAIEWQGSVQRVVDGESHQFSGWQGLTDLLLAMVSQKVGR